jgi:hypothetical protein
MGRRVEKQLLQVADAAERYLHAQRHLDRLRETMCLERVATPSSIATFARALDRKARNEGRLIGALFRLDEIVDA